MTSLTPPPTPPHPGSDPAEAGEPNPSTRLAREALAAVVRAGVRHLVLSPGSRSAPLAFAAYDLAAAGVVRLHTRIDERSAGFLALGLGKAGSPTAVFCTSGTAVANLHPAVLEAAHAGVPLVVLTADRPARLRGTGANQTTDQRGIFGPEVAALDLSAADLDGAQNPARLIGNVLGERGWMSPLQVNLQFDEPLLPPGPWADLPVAGEWTAVHPREPRVELPLGPRTVVVAGDDAGPPARQLAEAAGWPLLAEPTAGCRTGENAIRSYRLLLGQALGERIERVIVAGHPTLSRPVSRLLARADVEVHSISTRGCAARRPFEVVEEAAGFTVAGADDPEWLAAWQAADREVGREVDRYVAGLPELTPYAVAGAVSRALPPGGMLLVGASNPIRDLDLMARPYPVGERRRIMANRGLAGIDGTVSTAIGAALARRGDSRNLALLGDVTFLHDSNGLLLGPSEQRPELTLVVVNDDGGSIFSVLEQGAEEYADRFDTLFATPHGADLAALCAATRTPHWRVESLPELEHALASPSGGIEVIEARVSRADRRSWDARLRELAAVAAERALIQ